MKKQYIISYNLVFIIISILLSVITLSSYGHTSSIYLHVDIKVKIAMMNTIWFFFVLFYILTFLIDYKLYITICACIVIIGIPAWIYNYYIELTHGEIFFLNNETIQEMIVLVCFSILSPGLTLIVIQFIKRNTSKFDDNRILGRYHMHEGFLGILLIIIAFVFWIIRIGLVQHEIFRTKLRIFLAFDMILLFVFLFFGSFLLFRDWRDVLKLNFFEIKNENESISENEKIDSNPTVFSQISSESVQFFKKRTVKIYPIGMFLSSFSANALIHGLDLFPRELFNLELESIVLFAIACCFLGAGMLGLDWYNLFAKIYPEKYKAIERKLAILND